MRPGAGGGVGSYPACPIHSGYRPNYSPNEGTVIEMLTPTTMEMLVLIAAYLHNNWELIVPLALLLPLIVLGGRSYMRRWAGGF